MAKPTDKNTKAEILTAYNQLADEKKALETEVKIFKSKQLHRRQ
jgi:hypothetical protein